MGGQRSNNNVASAPGYTLFRFALAYAISTTALNAATLFAMTIFPRKASREPMLDNNVASAPGYTLFRFALAYAISTTALNAATLFAMTIFPRKASREPMLVNVTDES